MSGCSATNMGGGVLAKSGGAAHLSQCTVKNCRAFVGAGVSSTDGGTFAYVSDCLVTGCLATLGGGGCLAQSTGALNIRATTISHCVGTGPQGSAGVLVNYGGSASIDNTTIIGCHGNSFAAIGLGFGTCVCHVTATAISDCVADVVAGAFGMFEESVFSMQGGIIKNCTAGSGGVGWVNGQAYLNDTSVEECSAGCEMRTTIFEHAPLLFLETPCVRRACVRCTLVTDCAGFWVLFSGKQILGNVTVRRCYSTGVGGAVRASDNSITVIENCAFEGCSARQQGGVIDFGAGNVDTRDTTFTECHSPSGGVIHSEGTCTAPNFGGCTSTFTGCTFLRCRATGGNSALGGFAMIAAGGLVVIRHCHVIDCSSEGYGGGVSIKAGNFEMYDSIIDHATSPQAAGVQVLDGGVAHLERSVLTRCSTDAVRTLTAWDMKGVTDQDSCLMGGLTGGGIDMNGLRSVVKMIDTEVSNCSANSGGGIHMLGGSLDLLRCNVTGNVVCNGAAGGRISGGTLRCKESLFADNWANMAGGGLGILFGGSAELVDTVFERCEALGWGAAVHVSPQTTLIARNSSLRDNIGSFDSGLYLEEGSILDVTMLSITPPCPRMSPIS
eukprot:7263542-Prymnesium_polylepis.1